jgi:hypothetical protein
VEIRSVACPQVSRKSYAKLQLLETLAARGRLLNVLPTRKLPLRPTALRSRKYRSEEDSKYDDLENIPSSNDEEKDRNSEKTNGARKMEKKNFRKVPSMTVHRSSKAAAITTKSAGAVSKKTAGRRGEQDEVNSAPSTSDETSKRNQQQAQQYQAREARAVEMHVYKHITEDSEP